MANRRNDALCVQIRVCTSNETEKDIIKFQAERIAVTGMKNYRKTEAASDYLEFLAAKERSKSKDKDYDPLEEYFKYLQAKEKTKKEGVVG